MISENRQAERDRPEAHHNTEQETIR